MEIQTPFHANYKLENPDELPASGHGVLHFPALSESAGRIYQERLKFTDATRNTWYGVFATQFKSGLSLATTMPNPNWCLVSAEGTGYLLNVYRPEEWSIVPVRPILNIRAERAMGVVLLNDFTRIVAFGEKGQIWRSESLCSDELQIKGLDAETIHCAGWDAPTGDRISFRVQLETGKLKT